MSKLKNLMSSRTKTTSIIPIIIFLTKLSLNFKTKHYVYCTIYKEVVQTTLDNPDFHDSLSYTNTSQT